MKAEVAMRSQRHPDFSKYQALPITMAETIRVDPRSSVSQTASNDGKGTAA